MEEGQLSSLGTDLAADDLVFATVADTIAAMFATDPSERTFLREWWPVACCEQAAVAIAAVLEDRGQGSWTLVCAGRPGQPNGHAWLERRDANGLIGFSIDPTLHQFERWDKPFTGPGSTPARTEFSELRFEGSIWDWPYLGGPNEVNQRLIRSVRAQLAAPGD